MVFDFHSTTKCGAKINFEIIISIFFDIFDIFKISHYNVNSSFSTSAAHTNSVESMFIPKKYPTNRSFPKHSLRSDDRTGKRMRSRHNEIYYHETSIKSSQTVRKEWYSYWLNIFNYRSDSLCIISFCGSWKSFFQRKLRLSFAATFILIISHGKFISN